VSREARDVRAWIAFAFGLIHGFGFATVLRELDPQKPAHSIAPLEDLLANTVARDRFSMLLLGGFAGTALLLAALGIYGVLAQRAEQRVREFGIRMALGARRADIVGLMTGQGMRLVMAGAMAGLLGAWWLTRFLEGMLFGVRATDPLTFAVAVSLLSVAALAACVLPAWRASRIDPAIALRHE